MTHEDLDKHFRFKIGDLIAWRSAVTAQNHDAEVNPAPDRVIQRINVSTPMVVIGRLVEECHGGVQFFYLARDHAADGLKTFRLTDAETVPYEDHVALVKRLAAARDEKYPRDREAR